MNEWWLVWLQTADDAYAADVGELDMAVCVQASNAERAERIARLYAAAEDSWIDGVAYAPESYKLLRITEATVGVK